MRTDIFVAAEMYTNQLIDGYKEQRKYVQLDVRKGRTCLKENQILMLVETIGEEKERALIGLAMDKAKTHEAQTLWQNIGKSLMDLDYLGFQWLALD